MATFSELYQNTGGPVSRAIAAVLHGVKYTMRRDLCSQQIVDVAQNASVEFLKAFWSLSETPFMKRLPSWICPRLEVIEEIFIPSEAITLPDIDTGEPVIVPGPGVQQPIRCLLLSAVHRKGQSVKKNNKKSALPSSNLLIHCHGGGFISHNPESHEIYLRHWAHDLNIPILSIDYSLSPESPFPRALDEVLLVYAWVLKNASKIGWTGDNIYFFGDSAGGNILMGTTLKTISLRIRKPDAILCAYSPLMLDMLPSPSRILCWLDPLLPLGFMLSCLGAYAGTLESNDEYDDKTDSSSTDSRSRKVSSISEILDTSLMFLKQLDWIEVDTESSLSVDTFYHSTHGTSNKVNENDYTAVFLNEYNQTISSESLKVKLEDGSENVLLDLPQDLLYSAKQQYHKFTERCFDAASSYFRSTSLYGRVSSLLPYKKYVQSGTVKESLRSKNTILHKIQQLKLKTNDYFMSPLLAPEELLREMPPSYFVTLNFDPCLDDTITMAKRISAEGRFVVVDVLDGLPHGFLNFLPFSQEAHDGSNVCIQRLKEAMRLFGKS